MELYKNTRVVFDETPHTYTLDGRSPLMGVTTLMRKHGLSADYTGVDEETLKQAAALGTAAHKQIEDYCNGLPSVDTPLVKSFKKLALDIICTEYLVSDNETVASSIDLVAKVSETEVALIDIKRTSSVHRDALAWQLGIYKHLFEAANPSIKVVKCQCLPIKKGSTEDITKDKCSALVDITPVSVEEVKDLLAAESCGMLYAPAPDTTATDLVAAMGEEEVSTVLEAARVLGELDAQIKACEGTINAFKARVYDYMLEHDLSTVSVAGMALSLTRPYESNAFDSKKYMAEHPEEAEKYTYTKSVRGNVKINFKRQS